MLRAKKRRTRQKVRRPVIRAEPHRCCSARSGWGWGFIPSAANLLFPRQPSCTHTRLLAQRADWQEEPCSSLSEKVQRHRLINTNSPCSEFQAGWVLTASTWVNSFSPLEMPAGERVIPSPQMRTQRNACSPGVAFYRC